MDDKQKQEKLIIRNDNFVDKNKGNLLFYFDTKKDALVCNKCKEDQYKVSDRYNIKAEYKNHINNCENKVCRCKLSFLESQGTEKKEIIDFLKRKDPNKYKYKCPYCGGQMKRPEIINQPAGYYQATQYFLFCECKKCGASFSEFQGEY